MRTMGVGIAVILALGVAAPVFGARPARPDKGKVEGTILELRETTATGSEGAFTDLRIRDRVRQELWLRLGPAGESRDRFRVGDRVRAEIVGGAPGEPAPVRSIYNERTRERDRIRARDGSMLSAGERARDRERERAKSEARERDRTRDQRSGERPGDGNRPGGGDRPGGADRPGGGGRP